MFWLGFFTGILASLSLYLVVFLANRVRVKDEGTVRPKAPALFAPGVLSRRSEKRKPKALTDLMAYQREIQEEGENRG